MKEAYWGYWLVVLGVFIIVVLLLVQSFTSTNTQDYYLIKTITEASMEDAIDWSYYRQYGEAKINKEKFYESFLRRFAEEASISTTYDIEFTEVYEAPPKVGVKVSSKSNTFNVVGDSKTFDIVNKIDAILESKVTAVQGETFVGEQYAVDVSYLLDRLEVDNSLPSTLTNCKLKFNAGSPCATESAEEIIIQRCGKPTESGILNELNANTIYCIASKAADSTCSITATYDQFFNTYCN
ncbi:MAG: hypothetical protein E7167_03365 [Firmicutes bacterium]|nr:hypothetical protein [Bacillota bacterium]